MIYANKKLNNIIIVLLCLVFIAGCAQNSATDISQTSTNILPENIPLEYDEATAAHIALGDKISVSGSGAQLQKNVITIFKEGTYIFEGTLPEGQIMVNAENADVRIVLKNAHVTCSYSAALYVKNAARVILTLADGTQNSLSDMDSRPSDDSIDGAVYSKAPLAINGNGVLSVSGTYKHGISSKEAVAISGGNISLSALKTGLDSRGDIILDSSSLNISAGTNGIRSGREDQSANISVLRGTYSITSAGDGIQSYGNIDISHGTLMITTGGGSAKAPVKYSEFSMNGRGSKSIETNEDTSRKGIKAAGDISVSGGSCTVDSYDDGIHADGNITISGGTHNVISGDDGIHAECALLISGGSIDIPYCYEGLEGKSVTITEGTVNIHANDDGINTAADETAETGHQAPQMPDDITMPQMPENMTPPNSMEMPEGFTPPVGMEFPEGFTPPDGMEFPEDITPQTPEEDTSKEPVSGKTAPDELPKGKPSFGMDSRPGGFGGGFGGIPGETAQEGVDISISGGTITISADGDCMDSNGNIYISGGTVYISANRYPVIGFAESGLDCNGTLTVSGGSLIGTGTSASETNGLEDAAIVYYDGFTFDEGMRLTLTDAHGNTLFEFIPSNSFNSVLIASPSLVVGETYTLTIGDMSEHIQLTEQLLTVGESSGGFGFRGRPDISSQFGTDETTAPSPDPDTAAHAA